jgi:hypothetical protein
MPTPSSLHEYLRLCGAPHNRRYVVMSVMLSSFRMHRPFASFPVSMTT